MPINLLTYYCFGFLIPIFFSLSMRVCVCVRVYMFK